ncbi:hypothetical protein EDD27_7988 [Nonomuraea polychroma]|uniref:Uncharacterized protein n=1 Tax=Nonomuraea polychroma TaxID=46176 RepID=A0A438MH78_9ACTN|nr:hypothetical protein [Nonomuraea polychroma]RVX45202.1 hypothetical protein EDD27_7988 [Nonomuraea polychroma]
MEAEPVAIVGLARATDLVRSVGQSSERSRRLSQGRGPERIDAVLAGALGDDDAGTLKGLQVLGRLRLAGLGELSEDTDRPGPLGQQAAPVMAAPASAYRSRPDRPRPSGRPLLPNGG